MVQDKYQEVYHRTVALSVGESLYTGLFQCVYAWLE